MNAAANRPLTPTQERVYARLLDHQRRTGRLPELSDLARSLGIHYVSLRQHLEALQKKGYLEFESRGRGRSPFLALPPQATGIPVLGDIPAGPFDAAVAHPEAYLPIPALVNASFALRVRGDSMADLIQPGDVVLLSRRPPARDGEICAVRVGEEDVTLKYVRRLGGGQVELRPHNPAYETMVLPAEEVSIDGVYLGLLRGAAADALLEPN